MKYDYEAQANNFLRRTKSEFEVKFLRYGKHISEDKYERDIYKITIIRNNRKFVCEFGQSLNCSGMWWKYGNYKRGVTATKPLAYEKRDWDINPNYKAPSAYDVLACLEKYNPETFEDFCANYSYDTDSRKAERAFEAVKKEYNDLALLYNDEELEEMAEIA